MPEHGPSRRRGLQRPPEALLHEVRPELLLFLANGLAQEGSLKSMSAMFRLDDDDEMLRWDAFIDAHPEGTPLHRSGWLKTISRTYAIDPWLFVSEDAAGAITALAPFFRLKRPLYGYRLVSLPFSDFCGPLGLERTDVRQLLQKVLERASARSSISRSGVLLPIRRLLELIFFTDAIYSVFTPIRRRFSRA